MIFITIQITLISGLTCFFLLLNRSDKSGINPNLISLCFLICLLSPMINKLPVDLPSMTFNNKWSETIVNTPNWQEANPTPITTHPISTPVHTPHTINNTPPKINIKLLSKIENLLICVWLAGVIVQLTLKYIRFRTLNNMVLNGRPLETVQSKLTVLTSHLTDVPFLFVGKKAYIILPEEVRNWHLSHIQNIIAHELCHYERKDHWHLSLANILTTIYWFHPLVKYLSDRQNFEIESACDEQLINQGIDKISYAETLLAFVNNKSSQGYASMATKPKLIQLRIRSVLNQTSQDIKKTKKPYLIFISAILMSSGCTDLTQLTWLPSTQMIELIGHDLPTLRENHLTKNEVMISALYDGKANNKTFIHLEIHNMENEASWLALGPLRKFNDYIHTWHFQLKNNSHFTGTYKIIGAENDGVVDGVALGVLMVDSTGNIELLKTKSELKQGHTPNIVCAWPLGISEVEFMRVLPQLSYNSPDAVERILCGAQLVQNGQHQLN